MTGPITPHRGIESSRKEAILMNGTVTTLTSRNADFAQHSFVPGRAKALARAGGRTPRRSCPPAARRQVHRAQQPPGRLRPDRPVAGLLLEGIVLRLRADLRWLEACERKWAGRGSVS